VEVGGKTVVEAFDAAGLGHMSATRSIPRNCVTEQPLLMTPAVPSAVS